MTPVTIQKNKNDLICFLQIALCLFLLSNNLFSQSSGYNAFNIKINENEDVPEFTIINTSTNGSTIESITIKLGTGTYTGGANQYNWDNTRSRDIERPNGGSCTVAIQNAAGAATRRSDIARITFDNFNEGERARFCLELDQGNRENLVNYSQILFEDAANNIQATTIQVEFGDGQAPVTALKQSSSTQSQSSFNTYKQDFNSFSNGIRDLGDGTIMVGSQARIVNNRLRLTQDRVHAGFSSFSIPPLAGSSQGFTATFDYILSDSRGSNVPADGFSFNYGSAAMGERGSAEEGMAGRGVSDNISFQVDTWQNGSNDWGYEIDTTKNGTNRTIKTKVTSPIADGETRQGTIFIEYNPNQGSSFKTTGLRGDIDWEPSSDSTLSISSEYFAPNDGYTFNISARVGGATETLDIDNLVINAGQGATFYSFNGPETDLTVQSTYTSGNNVQNVNAGTVDIPNYHTNLMSHFNSNPGIKLANGTRVQINIPEYVYFDSQGQEINAANAFSNAAYRYRPQAITLGDTPQSGNQRTFSFRMSEPTTIAIVWVKEWAVNIQNVFTDTSSNLLVGGNKWAGPMTETAAGRPEISIGNSVAMSGHQGKHFVPDNEGIVYSVDGAIPDPVRLELPVRYILDRYELEYKNPNGTTVDSAVSFPGSQLQSPSRQSTSQHTTTSELTYRIYWKIQYGIQNMVVASSRDSAPIIDILDGNGNSTAYYAATRTHWVYPGGNYFVGSRRTVDDATHGLRQLGGWVNGDSYYFEGFGNVNASWVKTSTGGDWSGVGNQQGLTASGETRADWLVQRTIGSNTYAGYKITNIQRPVKVQWEYGDLAIDETITVGDYAFESGPNAFRLQDFTDNEPQNIQQQTNQSNSDPNNATTPPTPGPNSRPNPAQAFYWDEVNRKLYPIWAGDTWGTTYKYEMDWTNNDGVTYKVTITVEWPDEEHYPHVVGAPPINLDPDPDDYFKFNGISHTDCTGVVDENDLFTTGGQGITVLSFSKLSKPARGPPKEAIAIRTVRTKAKADLRQSAIQTVYVGSTVTDVLDTANLGSGYIVESSEYSENLSTDYRINPLIYDHSRWNGLNPSMLYVNRKASNSLNTGIQDQLPGPIIPVNIGGHTIEVGWFQNPKDNDGLLWPNGIRQYHITWPDENRTKRIVIASQWGSESLGADGKNQFVIGSSASDPTTYDPSRFQNVTIYHQDDINEPGYNPNEEHAIMVPSLRFADVSPRPPAAYALRAGDLNKFDSNNINNSGYAGYTSVPRVLVSFYDTVDETYKMNIYKVVKETQVTEFWADSTLNISKKTHQFANAQNLEASANPTIFSLNDTPHIKMNAGEPVIPFYPLSDVIGASPLKETYGSDITIEGSAQKNYWQDKYSSNWSVSGGDKAWFRVNFYYPLLTDFWWPDGQQARVVATLGNDATATAGADNINGGALTGTATITAAGTGYSSAPTITVSGGGGDGGSAVATVLGGKITSIALSGGAGYTSAPTLEIASSTTLKDAAVPTLGGAISFLPDDVTGSTYNDVAPQPILYKSEWPDTAPILKAGETLTFAGGEFRADNPTTETTNSNGELVTIDTEGLPGIVGFASAQIEFDSLNPTGSGTDWTARIIEPLKVRSVTLTKDLPNSLKPASGNSYVSEGKYVFKSLSASLKKRFRYDPRTKKLEFFGFLNNKKLGDKTLTASPSAVYVLEPNILTDKEKTELQNLVSANASQNEKAWISAVSSLHTTTNSTTPGVLLGAGLALVPNQNFLDPSVSTDSSWLTIIENNHSDISGSPITPHIIKVDRQHRYRGSIKTILSDNVFDESINLQHMGEFGAKTENLVFEWWYRIDDGSQNVPPPDKIKVGQPNPWKLYPDQSGQQGKGRFKMTVKGTPNAPDALLSDTFWFCRYRHVNEIPEDPLTWNPYRKSASADITNEVINFDWAGAGNSQPFVDADLDGYMDYRAQLVMGWLKRVMDAINPYEARISDFSGDSPSTVVSMLSQFGPRYEGPVALNPDKNVIENVGLIELYRTLLERAKGLSIDLSRPISTPGIANALQLASTRLSEFYNILGNEAYTDALDHTIGFGSDSVEYGSLAPAIHAFQNQTGSLLEEELALLRGVDDYYARPVYNRLFWNFTKAEGEAAYAMNYNLSDVNLDGFINEDDAMLSYPQGHGDAWGHYLSAMKHTYDLLSHPNFNWVSRSESYNLQDVVISVDFLDERKFAATAAAKAKTGKEILDSTYRSKYVEDVDAQWQGYTDTNEDRAWGVQGWARRAGQGAYFDWVTANALLPSEHPNENLEGIEKVDRKTNSDISVISANLNSIQVTFDRINDGYNPLGIPNGDSVVMDFDPTFTEVGSGIQGEMHFGQLFSRAVTALDSAVAVWDYANEPRNMIRQISNTEEEFRNEAFQEDLSYQNQLIGIFGRPYEGTIGSNKFYPEGYDGPDLALYMYADKSVREITHSTVPRPTITFADFSGGSNDWIPKGDLFSAWYHGFYESDSATSVDAAAFWTDGRENTSKAKLKAAPEKMLKKFAPTFYNATGRNDGWPINSKDGWYNVEYTSLTSPRVDLVGLTDAMPVTAGGYTFEAPASWGKRTTVGQLQMIITQMIQKEAEVAEAIAAWDALTGEILRQIHLYNSLRYTGATKKQNTVNLARTERAVETVINIIKTARSVLDDVDKFTAEISDGVAKSIPGVLPTGGFAISPGDALSFARGGVKLTSAGKSFVMDTADQVMAVAELVQQEVFAWLNMEVGFVNDQLDRDQNQREQLKEVEDLVGDEAILRVGVFKEIQGLRELSDQYSTLIDEGARLVDERQAFNKRMAASVQKARYQDINFRYSRNHALQNYRSAFNLAARYAYMAGKAYEYSTNLPVGHEGSVLSLLEDIVKARGIGYFDGEPRIGKGGISEALAKMKANYDALKGQLGLNNTQMEFSRFSLREELMRIYPKNSTDPTSQSDIQEASNIGILGTASNANDLWKTALTNAKVENLWDVREYRNKCRPIASRYDINGNEVPEPGLVLRFSTEITAGKNFFGKPLAGGDHTFDPSNYTTKIRAVGVNFIDYQSSSLLTGLSDSPRIYLVPSGSDMMGYPTLEPPDSSRPETYRAWNIIDHKVPVPFKATSSTLDRIDYNPIIDNINDRFGDPRRFSSFRAHHLSTGQGSEDDMVYDSRLVGRSVWNSEWVLIIPGRSLNYDGDEGIQRLINQISDIELYFDTFGMSAQ